MKKETILYSVIGLLTGVILAGSGAAYAVNNNHQGMMKMMGMDMNATSQGMMDDSAMSMGDMTSALKGRTGDDFDKAFISGMIVHHQGAIDMAKLAQQNAKHEEVKNLANDILSAQSKEIDTMQTWQTDWGYKNTPSIESSHNMNNMMGQ